MCDPDLNQEAAWARGWEAHELAQLRRLAKLSFSEKLDWLEQAHRIVLHMSKTRTGQPPTRPEDLPRH
jgi:hypothetical protein